MQLITFSPVSDKVTSIVGLGIYDCKQKREIQMVYQTSLSPLIVCLFGFFKIDNFFLKVSSRRKRGGWSIFLKYTEYKREGKAQTITQEAAGEVLVPTFLLCFKGYLSIRLGSLLSTIFKKSTSDVNRTSFSDAGIINKNCINQLKCK